MFIKEIFIFSFPKCSITTFLPGSSPPLTSAFVMPVSYTHLDVYKRQALDQACVDAVYASPDPGKATLIERMESRNGIHTVETACALGIGVREYELIYLD